LQSLENIGQMRGIISRSLLYLAFGRRLLRRSIRVSFEVRRLRRLLRVSDERLRTVLRDARESDTREIRRLSELVTAYQTKIGILHDEYADRILEIQKTIGISFATREPTERIQNLNYQPFEDFRKAERAKKNDTGDITEDDLTPMQRARYDSMYESHVDLGFSQGYTESEIKAVWEQNAREDALYTVTTEN
jgi:hypothetical protein